MSEQIRRSILRASAALALAGLATGALAHHGWSSFDEQAPLYLAGTVGSVSWENPHAILTLDPDDGLVLPPDLSTRSAPAQQAPVDGARVLADAKLPDAVDAEWEIELAPLTRMSAWQVPTLQAGARVEVVGYTFPGQRGERVMRVEYLFVDGKAYGLRSLPR
jgi:hypothetical protein